MGDDATELFANRAVRFGFAPGAALKAGAQLLALDNHAVECQFAEHREASVADRGPIATSCFALSCSSLQVRDEAAAQASLPP